MSKKQHRKESREHIEQAYPQETLKGELSESFFEKRLNRREAVTSAGKVAIGAMGALIVAGVGTAVYFTGPSSQQAATTTSSTSTSTTSSSIIATPSITESQSYVINPEVTEGPYFIDEALSRSDIRVDPTDNSVQQGVKLILNLTVHRTTDGASWSPFAGAHVDLWHANYQGVYSDEAANGSVGKKFLRGYQVADQNGAVQFTTVYPGWYSGRTIHIHVKIRNFSGSTAIFTFTSQLFVDDSITDQVLVQSPYSSRGLPDTTNASDSVYAGASSDGSVQKNVGDKLLLILTKDSAGYTGAFNFGVKTTN